MSSFQPRTCAACGDAIPSSRFDIRHPRPRYCSKKCSRRAQYLLEKRDPRPPRTCGHCGTTLPVSPLLQRTDNRRRYCGIACKRKAYKARDPKRHLRLIRDWKRRHRACRCGGCGEKLPAERGATRKYCSPKCRNVAAYRRRRPHDWKWCRYCREPIKASTARLYCSDRCASRIHTRRRMRDPVKRAASDRSRLTAEIKKEMRRWPKELQAQRWALWKARSHLLRNGRARNGRLQSLDEVFAQPATSSTS